MLEVAFAAFGSAIAGAAKGYSASFRSPNPFRLFLASAGVASLGFLEAARYQRRRKEVQGHIPGASSHIMDDTIIESSPTYLVENSPLFVGLFAAAYTIVGGSAVVFRKQPLGALLRKFTHRPSGIVKR